MSCSPSTRSQQRYSQARNQVSPMQNIQTRKDDRVNHSCSCGNYYPQSNTIGENHSSLSGRSKRSYGRQRNLEVEEMNDFQPYANNTNNGSIQNRNNICSCGNLYPSNYRMKEERSSFLCSPKRRRNSSQVQRNYPAPRPNENCACDNFSSVTEEKPSYFCGLKRPNRKRGASYNQRCPCDDKRSSRSASPDDKDLWDMQFCRWWGWNRVRKNEELRNSQKRQSNIETLRNLSYPNCPCKTRYKPRSKFKTFCDMCKDIYTENRQKIQKIDPCVKYQLQTQYATPCGSVVLDPCQCNVAQYESNSLVYECSSSSRNSVFVQASRRDNARNNRYQEQSWIVEQSTTSTSETSYGNVSVQQRNCNVDNNMAYLGNRIQNICGGCCCYANNANNCLCSCCMQQGCNPVLCYLCPQKSNCPCCNTKPKKKKKIKKTKACNTQCCCVDKICQTKCRPKPKAVPQQPQIMQRCCRCPCLIPINMGCCPCPKNNLNQNDDPHLSKPQTSKTSRKEVRTFSEQHDSKTENEIKEENYENVSNSNTLNLSKDVTVGYARESYRSPASGQLYKFTLPSATFPFVNANNTKLYPKFLDVNNGLNTLKTRMKNIKCEDEEHKRLLTSICDALMSSNKIELPERDNRTTNKVENMVKNLIENSQNTDEDTKNLFVPKLVTDKEVDSADVYRQFMIEKNTNTCGQKSVYFKVKEEVMPLTISEISNTSNEPKQSDTNKEKSDITKNPIKILQRNTDEFINITTLPILSPRNKKEDKKEPIITATGLFSFIPSDNNNKKENHTKSDSVNKRHILFKKLKSIEKYCKSSTSPSEQQTLPQSISVEDLKNIFGTNNKRSLQKNNLDQLVLPDIYFKAFSQPPKLLPNTQDVSLKCDTDVRTVSESDDEQCLSCVALQGNDKYKVSANCCGEASTSIIADGGKINEISKKTSVAKNEGKISTKKTYRFKEKYAAARNKELMKKESKKKK